MWNRITRTLPCNGKAGSSSPMRYAPGRPLQKKKSTHGTARQGACGWAATTLLSLSK
jgi:hypothetical protein